MADRVNPLNRYLAVRQPGMLQRSKVFGTRIERFSGTGRDTNFSLIFRIFLRNSAPLSQFAEYCNATSNLTSNGERTTLTGCRGARGEADEEQ